ncbi:MAG: PH domain-containing protein [Pseudomonadaceae bacterium]|nr:PH domain-containing protein [Pseudomonadaceae bacterium]
MVMVAGAATAGMLFVGLLSTMSTFEAVTLAFFIGAIALLMMFQLRAVVSVEDDRLRINCMFASFVDKIDNLEPDVSDKFLFRSDEKYALSKLYLGTRVLGFYVGWYTLKDGSVAFACVSRKRHARALSTKDGVRLVLDPGLARQIASAAA